MAPSPSTSIPLASLPLRPSTLEILQQRGFTNTSEVARSRRDGGLANLAAELGCTLSQATDYFRELQGCLAMTTTTDSQRSAAHTRPSDNQQGSGIRAMTASELLSLSSSMSNKIRRRTLVSFCRSIDSLLEGGIAIGEVTEVSGNPGCGKTQLSMQLSVNARLPTEYGGVSGETVYIDSEGNFCPERCYTMALALVDHVRRSAERKRRGADSVRCLLPEVPEWFEPDNILKGIHVYRPHDEAAQTATILALPAFLRQRADKGCPIRLVVVDSIAFHYRCASPGGNYMARIRSLSTVSTLLSDIAASFDVAVVVINQMTTKFGFKGGGFKTESRLVPALGESWSHATTTRLILSSSHSQTQRTCNLVKSPRSPCGVATYIVLECGIRDVGTPDITSRISSRHQMDESKRICTYN